MSEATTGIASADKAARIALRSIRVTQP